MKRKDTTIIIIAIIVVIVALLIPSTSNNEETKNTKTIKITKWFIHPTELSEQPTTRQEITPTQTITFYEVYLPYSANTVAITIMAGTTATETTVWINNATGQYSHILDEVGRVHTLTIDTDKSLLYSSSFTVYPDHFVILTNTSLIEIYPIDPQIISITITKTTFEINLAWFKPHTKRHTPPQPALPYIQVSTYLTVYDGTHTTLYPGRVYYAEIITYYGTNTIFSINIYKNTAIVNGSTYSYDPHLKAAISGKTTIFMTFITNNPLYTTTLQDCTSNNFTLYCSNEDTTIAFNRSVAYYKRVFAKNNGYFTEEAWFVFSSIKQSEQKPHNNNTPRP